MNFAMKTLALAIALGTSGFAQANPLSRLVISLDCKAVNALGTSRMVMDPNLRKMLNYVNGATTPYAYPNAEYVETAVGTNPPSQSSVNFDSPVESVMGMRVLYHMYFNGVAKSGVPTQLTGTLYRTAGPAMGVPVSHLPVAALTCQIVLN